MASSSDGSKLVAAAENGFIYTSSNAGADWTITHAPNSPAPNSTGSFSLVASSADGTKLVALGYGISYDSANSAFYAGISYASANSGASWTPTSLPMTNFWSAMRLRRMERNGSSLLTGMIKTGAQTSARFLFRPTQPPPGTARMVLIETGLLSSLRRMAASLC